MKIWFLESIGKSFPHPLGVFCTIHNPPKSRIIKKINFSEKRPYLVISPIIPLELFEFSEIRSFGSLNANNRTKRFPQIPAKYSSPILSAIRGVTLISLFQNITASPSAYHCFLFLRKGQSFWLLHAHSPEHRQWDPWQDLAMHHPPPPYWGIIDCITNWP